MILFSRDPGGDLWNFMFQNRWRVATFESPAPGDHNDDKLASKFNLILETSRLGSILSRPLMMSLTHLRTILKTACFVLVSSNERKSNDSKEAKPKHAELI